MIPGRVNAGRNRTAHHLIATCSGVGAQLRRYLCPIVLFALVAPLLLVTPGELVAAPWASPQELALTAGAVFLGAVVSGLAGFAFSAIAGGLLLLLLPGVQAVPVLLVCSIVTQLICVSSLWRSLQWRASAPYLLGGLVGIPVGTYVLQALDSRSFAVAFGAMLIGYGAFMLAKPRCILRCEAHWTTLACGLAGGITGGAVAFPGAVPSMWLSLRGFAKDIQRGILQPYILGMQFATLAYFSNAGLLTTAATQRALVCVPAVVAGTLVGLAAFRRIDDAAFRRIVLIFLLISGLILILR